ncbi:sigma-70 family RNA polymerase sigma factor [Streptomyces lunaelactis]|uniref:RNA polymerase sigma factor n=1 Tax=Streptomyces lunaelactis TaxID=1535768 RepID=UPI0015848773|nr:sigma-70 family RNA polymerase sigma factor [Streptomyces lunaelactis]NUK09071.1 sigma-70 family RNA polymerase sigma factor [Streptomyces lunaelactis]NUK35158.1 sigma-70 family RNA polymerase sigma factor [Streptomyces lunaelactis]NUK41737.1 sigma-70 family RNA polymerase sigma factor [Streptomyces lunaelactis]NUK50802.1 sigma-70 family RNA polymerase sigma factor [Streptomyces lunaelactis]NUK58019.1 sigma-70 family RNA polymerase sigma factor [Streptomyces lunaelactis]
MTTDTQGAHERWQRAWAHREQLLKVARRRSMSLEDAEDAVHEAMLRAAENPHLDEERLGAWLTTVTMRLCVDRYRQVNRETEVRSSPRLLAPVPVPVEEAVCDRAEAKWLARRSGELPARQAEALWLKAEDLDVDQVATKMGLSYRTVESLLARARRTLRNSLAGTLGLALWLIGRGRPRGGNAQAVAVASTAATLAVAGLILPYAHDGDGPHRSRPAVPAVSEFTDVQSPTAGGAAPAPGSSTDAGQGAGTAGTQRYVGPGLIVPPLPALPDLPLPAPDMPDIPDVTAVPAIPVPDLTAVPDLTSAPDLPAVPDLPAASELPSVPLLRQPLPTEPEANASVPQVLPNR